MLKRWFRRVCDWLSWRLRKRPTLTTLGRLEPDKPLKGNPHHFLVNDPSQGGRMEVRADPGLGITEDEHRMILGLPPRRKD